MWEPSLYSAGREELWSGSILSIRTSIRSCLRISPFSRRWPKKKRDMAYDRGRKIGFLRGIVVIKIHDVNSLGGKPNQSDQS